jgi:hypothetical protein
MSNSGCSYVYCNQFSRNFYRKFLILKQYLILCRINIVTSLAIGTLFRLLIGFIDNLQVVTTINYNTVTHLQSLYANLFILSAAVFSLTESNTSTKAFNSHFTSSQADLLYFSVLMVSIRSSSLRLTWMPLHSLRKLPENFPGRPRCLQDNPSAQTTEKTHLTHTVAKECLLKDCPATVVALIA